MICSKTISRAPPVPPRKAHPARDALVTAGRARPRQRLLPRASLYDLWPRSRPLQARGGASGLCVPEVNIRGNRVSPPAVSLSNRTPACWGARRPQRRLGYGETGFPHPPACGEAPGSLPQQGRAREGAALPKTPHGHRGGVRPAHGAYREHTGKPGFPTCGAPVEPPAVRRSNRTPAWRGASRSHQRLGNGEPGFPHLR